MYMQDSRYSFGIAIFEVIVVFLRHTRSCLLCFFDNLYIFPFTSFFLLVSALLLHASSCAAASYIAEPRCLHAQDVFHACILESCFVSYVIVKSHRTPCACSYCSIVVTHVVIAV